jgi:hypothetical protein
LPNKLCASGGDLLHRIQAMQQHVELQEELTDHTQDSGMALLTPILLSAEQYKCHHYVLLCSRQSMRY